jgi:hypothetical protein
MKIFLAFLQSGKQHPIPAYSFWPYYIKNGIEEAGHQWDECPNVDWAMGLVPKLKSEQLKWKAETWQKTIDWLKKKPVDIFLSYLYPSQIDVSAIQEIKKLGIPCVNFYCDNLRDFQKVPAEFAIFDLNWVPEYKALAMYKAANYPLVNLPMPMWVPPGERVLKPESNKQITFIGSKDIQRHLFFENIVATSPDLALAIYGKGWTDDDKTSSPKPAHYSLIKKMAFQYHFIKSLGISAYLRKIQQCNYNPQLSTALKLKTQSPITFAEYNTLTTGSMITIGVNRFPSYTYQLNAPNSYSRLRDIEAPMLGACYLTEWTEGIDELYDIGTEIETYVDIPDFINKISMLQLNPDKRKMLKKQGQIRALNNHSIPVSLNKLIKTLIKA